MRSYDQQTTTLGSNRKQRPFSRTSWGENTTMAALSSAVALGAIAGIGMATVAIPATVGALGFTGAGIASGSWAAKMMSVAAIANGGEVAAGSVVAVLQSIGAVGLPAAAQAAITAGAALLPAILL